MKNRNNHTSYFYLRVFTCIRIVVRHILRVIFLSKWDLNRKEFFRATMQKRYCKINSVCCFNDISVNANLISVRLKSKWQRINTINFYLRDISTPLVGIVFKHVD